MKDWRHLRGKRVVVRAAGVTYRGTVVELSERVLVLRGTGGFQEIPWEAIARIDEEGPGAPSGPAGPLPQGWG